MKDFPDNSLCDMNGSPMRRSHGCQKSTQSTVRNFAPPGEACSQGFYTPFEGLDQHFHANLRKPQDSFRSVKHAPACDRSNRKTPTCSFSMPWPVLSRSAATDQSAFPRPPRSRHSLASWSRKRRRCVDTSVDLVSGEAPFELWYSDEYVDGAVVGLSPVIVKKLKKGVFSYQDYVDLHGCKREEAREKVNAFCEPEFCEKTSMCSHCLRTRG